MSRTNYGESFISAVLDRDDIHAFDRYGITREVLSEDDRPAYDFIREYADENGGRLPDYRTLEANVDGFVYIPEIKDTFRYMAEKIKQYSGKKRIAEIWGSEDTAKAFSEMDADQFAEMMMTKLQGVWEDTRATDRVGFNLKRDVDYIMGEYAERKAGKSFQTFESAFPMITQNIGKYQTSNVYVWFGRSGRGKSVITMIEALWAAMQGATVLIWSLEMATYELVTRMISALSAMMKIFEVSVQGKKMPAGFDTRGIMYGNLEGDMEAHFHSFLKKLNERVPGEIIVRAIDDESFRRRDVRMLEADIKRFDADVVVVDPIYYMDMERNTSNTAGGDVAKTSQAIRLMAGRMKVVMHVITQAEEVSDDESEEGERTLRLPKRKELKKAKQILEDSSYTFAIDTCGGRGLIGCGKGRAGGEDVTVEIVYLPQYGIVQQISRDEAEEMFEQVGDTGAF